uniref:Putative odorant-binding protein A5 n=1 Tax=Lygus hesperus TaxID=30085 RepID=A0A0A9Z8I4_LYGHE
MIELETKYCVASLLDAQQRYNVMMNEARFCRNTVLGLPTPIPPLFDQFSAYQCPPPSCSSTAPITNYSNSVNLHTFSELGNPDDNIGHVEVIATEFKTKPPQFTPNEPKKPSFQIEDIISSTPSSSYGPDSTNNYQMGYGSYAESTPKRMRMGRGDEVKIPTVNIAQETLGSWRNYYTDLVSEPRSVSSNGSHSLFIDTSRLSPLSSETLSANELCDDPTITNDPTMTNEFDSTIETSIEEVSLQPSYQTLASNFLTTLDNQVLNDVDSRGQYPHVVEEITYQETEPSHNYATVVFQKPDPLDLKQTVDELSNEDTEKIFDGLKHLQKSLGIRITTDTLGPSIEVQTECDSSNMEEEKSDTVIEETVIEKMSSPDSGYAQPTDNCKPHVTPLNTDM